ncbi:pilus assembly protein [Asticcacaulis sp. BYS171W]|uniref:Pilus assembly protein n=1 Tax=Asticcacaulis aquaticus TaxID=2984212 RepID=A0ABT5HV17_9CAUL|nr:pilus assembly protein [Asticcacaulis aquaticus]MDC7683927.1 pilus assembly protein [Asticcacaulis aquaticus]
MNKPLMTKLAQAVKALWRDRRGNTTMIFGLSALTLVSAAGAGIDFSRAESQRSNLQDAADAAVLRGALLSKQGLTTAQTAANTVFAQNLVGTDLTGATGSLALTTSGNMMTATYTASASVKTMFLGLVNMSNLKISAVAKAQTIMRKAEIALVLDDSGSMGNDPSRLTNLKSSVDSVLADLLTNGVNKSETKVSVVPFDSRIKVTPSTSYAWVDYGQAAYTNIQCNNSSCSNTTYSVTYANGYGARAAYSLTLKNPNGNNKTITMPAIADAKSKWEGCLIDRDQAYDVNETAPSGTTALYPARPCTGNLQDSSDLSLVREMSTDIAAARAHVQNMKSSGGTNITIGVQWGLETLSPSAPYTGGVAFKDTEVLKYMIIVTDGENSANRWYVGENYNSYINARTALACQRAKDLEITVYVVRVLQGDSTLLKNCASKTAYYYDLKSTSDLNSALSDVFNSIKSTRLTQ